MTKPKGLLKLEGNTFFVLDEFDLVGEKKSIASTLESGILAVAARGLQDSESDTTVCSCISAAFSERQRLRIVQSFALGTA